MYRQGRDWVVEHYDKKMNAWMQHHPTNYWNARAIVGEHNCRCKLTCKRHIHLDE